MADDERDAMEAVHREVLRGVESQLARPLRSPDSGPRDPDYNELEQGLAQWWRAHAGGRVTTGSDKWWQNDGRPSWSLRRRQQRCRHTGKQFHVSMLHVPFGPWQRARGNSQPDV
jgi:hypothetical protein